MKGLAWRSLAKWGEVILCLGLSNPMIPMCLQSQGVCSLPAAEKELNRLFGEIRSCPDDDERETLGRSIEELLLQTLRLPGSFHYPFDSLATLSKPRSPDHAFRIYTWNVPLLSGLHRFYGILQYTSPGNDSLQLQKLYDQSQEMPDPESGVMTPDHWYGAVYYQIIPENTTAGQRIYALLGWHGENILMQSKLIEILTITDTGELVFGKQLFCGWGSTRPFRLVFRYSSQSTMILRYERQHIIVSRTWDAKRKRFEYERERTLMIVTDRLVPADPRLEGQYEYYMPAIDIMDGFVFREGCWTYFPEVEVRNPKKRKFR